MKKKLLSIIMVTSMMVMLTACGSSEANTVTGQTQEPVSEVVEEKSSDEEVTVEDVISENVTEEVTTEVEEEKPAFEGLTEEWALEKLGLAKTAYKELTDHMDKPAESNALYAFYTNHIYHMDLKTKDGINLLDESDESTRKIGRIYNGVCTYYFDNFINNGGEYFDFADFITSHNYEDFDKMATLADSVTNTDECCMLSIIICESLSGTLSVRNISNEVTVEYKTIRMPNNEMEEAIYQCDIFMEDKDTGLKMLFDKDGNLLNFNSENYQNYPEFVMPFEQ